MRILASLAIFAALSAAQTKVTSVEGITEYRLDNGLQVLLFPDNSKPTVTVNMTFLVGSRHEGYGETGMAHLLEHMLFKGTIRHPDVKADLVSHGGNFNGSTSQDRTNYYETVSATDENLKWALDLEADRMVNSRVSRQDLDSEMTVVRSEFEIGENSPGRILEERVMSTAFLWHGYGRSPIGSRSDIEHVPIEKLQAFYHNYYQPDNAVLVVAGKFDPAKTLGWINETLGKIPRPTRKLSSTYTEEPTQDGERQVVLRRTGDNQIVIAAYHIPAVSHPDSAALEVLTDMLTAPPSGRLYKALVESKKATSAGGDEQQLHDPSVVLFQAVMRKDQSFDDAEKTMLGVVEGLAKEPPSKEEVDRARTRLLKNIDLAMNNSSSIGLVLSETASAGDWRLWFLDRDRIEKVTPEDITRVAKQYLKPDNRTIGRFQPVDAPDRAEIPAGPDLTAALKDYKGKASVEEGEVFDPSPANIEARVIRTTLPNGLKLVMLPKKSRGGTVTATLETHFGDEKSLIGKSTAAGLAGAMLMRGTTKHTRQQLTDELDKLKARVNVGGSAEGANASVSALRDTFTAALRLAAEVLKEPSFPETEFEQIRQSNLARVEAGRSDPQRIVSEQASRHMAPYPVGDPRHVNTIDETIEGLKKVTLDEAKKFYHDFYGASNAEMAVVGDFDPAEVKKLAGELFDGWKSPGPYTRISRTWQKLEAVNQTTETPDKANAILYAATTLAMDQNDPDFLALTLADQMLGGDPSSRLWARIREKEGLSYQVQSSFSAGLPDKFGRFLALAVCNPAKIVELEKALKEELTKAVREGFTEQEVEAAKKTLLDEQLQARSQDGGLAGSLATQARWGYTMARTEAREKQVASLTAAQVNAVAKKWIDPASFSIFKAGDFKKAGVTP